MWDTSTRTSPVGQTLKGFDRAILTYKVWGGENPPHTPNYQIDK